jgi:signal transduction histidine kinase
MVARSVRERGEVRAWTAQGEGHGAYTKEVAEAAVRLLAAIPGIARCDLFLRASPAERVALVFSRGASETGPLTPEESAGTPPSLVQDAVRGATRIVADSREGTGPVQAVAAFPIRVSDDVIGALAVTSAEEGLFTPAIASLCESAASGISAALRGTNVTELILRAKVALEETFDAMSELVAILDGEGRIRRLNVALARQLGRPLSELLGQDYAQLFPFCKVWLARAMGLGPTDRPGWEELADPASGLTYEVKLLRLETPSPVLGDRVVLMRDVTMEREMARQLMAFERRAAAGDLLNGVAHEVRNPLAAIQAAVQTLERDAPRGGETAELLEIIRRQVVRLADLMRDLLEVGRTPELVLREEALPSLCAAAIKTWRESPAHRVREVRLAFPGSERLPVRVDARRMEQVLINLLDNAAQNSAPQAPIEVVALREGDALCLRVCDQGRGIGSSEMARIFEPFFTTRAGGTGLGLTLVKSVVEAHAGSVRAWSNEPSPGATFEVRLPASVGSLGAGGSGR